MARLSKKQLLERIIEGCRDAGWGVLVVHDDHPFILRLFNEVERYLIRVYIWNLTHGGGAARPADEYRIQVTGIDTNVGFMLDRADKVLILGWWDEAEVFAGFDFNRHTGPLGHSPSIQIREEALRHASIRGIATHDKGSGEVAVAFKPELFPDYVRGLEQFHGFGESAADRAALEQVAERPEAVEAADVAKVSVERQTVLITIAKKLRDNSFKDRVLYAYGRTCAFCGMQLKLVDAAHILPVAAGGSDETSNGIALCALHHRAFDRALVTLNEEYQILVNDHMVANLRAWGLDGGEDQFRAQLRAVIRVPPTLTDRPAKHRIREANRLRGWAELSGG